MVNMNRLTTEKRAKILGMMVEGVSIRFISRLTGASKNTIVKLLEDAGHACMAFHDVRVRGVKAQRVQCDEIWSFCYSKSKNVPIAKAAPEGAGDVWAWTALDADSKLIVSWLVGDRNTETATAFMQDVADRLVTRVQLTTDGHDTYLKAVEGVFGIDVDFAQLVKIYGSSPTGQGAEIRYSSGECVGARKEIFKGRPDPKHISTSYVEQQNLSVWMGMRRFTRLTNAFSKKIDNHCHALAIYFMYYNFVRIHQSLRISPAMAAGVSDRLWSLEDIMLMVDDWELSKNAA